MHKKIQNVKKVTAQRHNEIQAIKEEFHQLTNEIKEFTKHQNKTNTVFVPDTKGDTTKK